MTETSTLNQPWQSAQILMFRFAFIFFALFIFLEFYADQARFSFSERVSVWEIVPVIYCHIQLFFLP